MPASGEYKTVQARPLAYAQEMGWTYVPRAEAETRRGFDLDRVTREARMLQQLTTAQIRVHDLDLDEFLRQAAAEIGGGMSPNLQHPVEEKRASR